MQHFVGCHYGFDTGQARIGHVVEIDAAIPQGVTAENSDSGLRSGAITIKFDRGNHPWQRRHEIELTGVGQPRFGDVTHDFGGGVELVRDQPVFEEALIV